MTFTFQRIAIIALWANTRTTSARASVLTAELGPIVDPLGLLTSLDHAMQAVILSLGQQPAVHAQMASIKAPLEVSIARCVLGGVRQMKQAAYRAQHVLAVRPDAIRIMARRHAYNVALELSVIPLNRDRAPIVKKESTLRNLVQHLAPFALLVIIVNQLARQSALYVRVDTINQAQGKSIVSNAFQASSLRTSVRIASSVAQELLFETTSSVKTAQLASTHQRPLSTSVRCVCRE
jgi:hypothetical protein